MLGNGIRFGACVRRVQVQCHPAANACVRYYKTPVHKDVQTFLTEARQKNLEQSQMKLSWLATLIRGAWVPDALAQLKFSPKHRAIDFAKMIQRAVAIARIHHDCIPEELFVKEVVVTKGICTRRMRIMGRGRVGIGYKRRAHVTIRLDRVDFDFKIKDSVDFNERGMWEKRQKWAEKKLKEKSDPDLSLKVM